VKDKETRESKGLAFILYLTREDAQKAVSLMSGKQVISQLELQRICFNFSFLSAC